LINLITAVYRSVYEYFILLKKVAITVSATFALCSIR